MISIRVDGNSEIGMGHVMRCLSIADRLSEKHEKVNFITASKECVALIQEKGYSVMLLDTDFRSMESEIPMLETIKTDVILIDSYQITENYVLSLKKNFKIAYMDDTGQSYPADLLINYNIYAPSLSYSVGDAIMLLGSEYIPVRREFVSNNEYELREEPKNIMITTGGSDPLFLSKALLDTFLNNTMLNKKELVYHVVSGPMNKFAEELKKQYGTNPQVVLHENVKNMVDVMKECDVIITAAGSTVYEACAVGIPMICFYFVENQRQIAEYFEKNTGVINCGDFSLNEKIACYNASDALVRCIIGRDTRRELSEEEKKLVDGQGASRIANELIRLGGK